MKKKQFFKTIAITSTSKEKRILDIARQCCEVILNSQIKVLVSDNLSLLNSPTRVQNASDEDIITQSDLLICIGGDGTMLSSARRFGFFGLPMLGINLGKLGFLTDIAPKDITTSLLEVINGEYIEDERFFLEARTTSSEPHLALNEVVIHSGAVAQLIEYEVYIDDVFVYRQSADGLIINSPTGSTAYSLSGGGPIVHPGVNAITLLPMFPHSLSSSSLIVGGGSKISIKMIPGKGRGRAKLSMDSHDTVPLKSKEIINIIKATPTLRLIHPKNHDFYFGCRNKLGWSSVISNKKEDK